MGRRAILLIAALLVAALGTALVWMYANRADERAQAGTEQVQVLVATTGITAGTTGAAISEAGSVELTTLPAASVPPGALSDLAPVTDLVAIGSIFQGQVLLQPMFGTQVESSGGLSLEEGQMAVSVSMGDPQRVAGFVSPGSEVAIFLTAATTEGRDAGEQQTALLLERVKVIAVGPTTISATTTTTDGTAGQTTNTEEIPTAILTLGLDQDQAQRVIQATSAGSMYFALLNAESELDPDLPGTTNANIFD
jgi:pilus assembly protein CpaB